MRRFTASKLELAAVCPVSHALPWVVEDGGEHAARGTLGHGALERIPVDGLEAAIAGLPAELQRVVTAVAETPSLAPLLVPGAASQEVAIEWVAETGVARVLGQGREAYASATPGAMVGTADVVAVTDDRVLIVDYKLGTRAVTHPSRNQQLRFLALAACRAFGRDQATIALAYGRDDEDAVVIEAELDCLDLETIADEMRSIQAGVQDVALEDADTYRRGEHCGRCPARTGCPAHVGLVRHVTRDVPAFRNEVGNAISLGAIQAAWAMAKDAESAVKMLLQQIRGLAFYTPIPLDDGKFLAWSLGSERVKSGDVVHEVLTRELGAEAAELAISVETKVTSTKTAIAKAMKGQTAKKKEEVWEALRKAGALVRKGGVREADAKDVAVPPSGPAIDATEGEEIA